MMSTKSKGMWLNEGGIANIVPLEVISKIGCITYDSASGMNAGHFVIHTDQGNITVQKNLKGMPFINLDNSVEGGGTGVLSNRLWEHGWVHA